MPEYLREIECLDPDFEDLRREEDAVIHLLSLLIDSVQEEVQ